ncbi:GntR family transcriptional regulator [Dactylosporangium matsuzakiense]|uniref:GntR family transcriptional regulator n=1 Tax=Dactylosporangium matsuzakiense TaxID=53360 RepID=A0A9W6NNV1_9ACTN|nr:GntR family transcriptional regulator [Dactylosporangium matsuzakiense]
MSSAPGTVGSVQLDVRPPKYIQIVNALQARIEDGTYGPGLMLPSETVLMSEFDASRPVVVRALEILRHAGWIESHQGKGRFVRGKPAPPRAVPTHAATLLAADAEGSVRVLDAAEVPAPATAAAALGLAPGTPVVMRRHLVSGAGTGPVELRTYYVPAALAAGTGIVLGDPLPRGLKEHLHVRKGLQYSHATERVSTRPASTEEQHLLDLDTGDWVLTMQLTVTTRDDTPAFMIDTAAAPGRLDFEDSFPVT